MKLDVYQGGNDCTVFLMDDNCRWCSKIHDLARLLNITDRDELMSKTDANSGIIDEWGNIRFARVDDAERFCKYLEPYLIMEELTK